MLALSTVRTEEPLAGVTQPQVAPARARVHRHELCFTSLYRQGYAFAFPCDEFGSVDVAALTPAALRNFFMARAGVGREYASPELRAMPGFAH